VKQFYFTFDNLYTYCVGVEVLTAVVMKDAISWDIALCSLYMNKRIGILPSHLLARWFLAQLIFYPENGGETLVHTQTTRCYIPEDSNFIHVLYFCDSSV
jgi:hypothetical protein